MEANDREGGTPQEWFEVALHYVLSVQRCADRGDEYEALVVVASTDLLLLL
jgi:hypothetical protein